MERFALVIGWFVIFCGGIAGTSFVILGACALFRHATREARANVDLWSAIVEWKRAHPKRAKRYSDGLDDWLPSGSPPASPTRGRDDPL